MIQNDQIDAVEDTLLQVDATHGVLANDTSSNGPLTVVEQLIFTAAGGQIEFLSDGSYDYVSAPGFSGTDSVQYTTLDASNQAAIGALTINVAATALLPFVSVGTQLSDRHVVTAGFGQVGNGIATMAGAPVPLSGGGYVIPIDYLDQANGTIYRVQIYDAGNNLISTFDPGQRIFDLKIAALSNGNYALGWDTGGASTGSDRTTHVQLFNAAGMSLAGPVTIDVPGTNDTLSTLAALPGGGFVALQLAAGVQLYARSFGADGTPDPQPVAIGTSTQTRSPAVLPDGEIVLSQVENNNELHLQRYDTDGNPIGSEIVPPSDGYDVVATRVVARPAGGFFVSWMSVVSNGRTPEEAAHIQMVDADGHLVGTQATMDMTFSAIFGQPFSAVTPLANGGFVVAWRGVIDNGQTNEAVQTYDASGNPVGGRIEFADLTAFGAVRALVYALPDGGFAISLQSADPANHNLLIYDNGGNAVGQVRMHDVGDTTGSSSIVLANLPNGKTLIMDDAFDSVAGNSHITVQTVDFSGSSTPVIQTGTTFHDDSTGIIPVMISLPDPDGSEIVQSIDVSGVPAGWTLSYPSATAVLNGAVWTITGVGIAHGGEIDLRLTPPPNTSGAATLTITAHTVDTVNNSQNQSFPATFSVTVTPFNDPPSDIALSGATVPENSANGTVVGTLTTTDVDNTSGFVYTLVNNAGGRFALSGDNLVVANGAQLDFEQSASQSVTVRVADPGGQTLDKTFSIAVTNVNEAPVAQAGSASGHEDTIIIGTLVATDVDSASLTYALVGQAAHGSVTVNTDGTFSYTPSADFNGTDSFTYKANDGSLDSNIATVTLAVAGVNDAPVNSVPGAQDIEANVATAIAGLSVADVDAGSGTMTTTLGVTHGTLTIASAGGAAVAGTGTGSVTLTGTLAQIDTTLGAPSNVVYHGAHDFFGADTLTMTTNDGGNTGAGGALSDTDQVAITLHTHLTGTQSNDNFTALSGNERIDALGGTDTISFGFKLVDATISFSGNQVIVDGPTGSHTVLTGFETYVFTDGTVNNNDSDPLVDDLFYYSQYHDVWTAHLDADQDYHANGWHIGRDPDAFFSTSTYLSANPDVKAAGVDPLVQYDQSGWKDGRVPSIAFSGNAYLAANPDVKAAGVDPLLHFLQFGEQEGRQPIAPTELIAPNGFDYVYYLEHNPDVAAAHVDPLQHFETYGWKEGRNPNALFDTNGYLAAYPDVKAAGINPLDHYDQFGWHEGRDPSVNFDTTDYLAAYPDIAAAHIDPLKHYLQYGIHEGRQAFADGHFG